MISIKEPNEMNVAQISDNLKSLRDLPEDELNTILKQSAGRDQNGLPEVSLWDFAVTKQDQHRKKLMLLGFGR
jgi:hypothetical protein